MDAPTRHDCGTLAALLLCVGACGGSAGSAGTVKGDTAYVGVAVGLTSPERYVNLFDGVQLAFDELNGKRPAKARILALRRAPTSADSPVKIATAFRDDPSIVAVIGHTESDATIAAAPVYADVAHGGRDPVIAVTTASASAVTRVSPWVYRINATTAEQARTLARYVADSLGLKRAGVLYRNEPSGKDFLKAFRDEFARKGGVVTERDPFTENIWDFDAYARRLVLTKTPAVVVAGNSPQSRSIIRALHAAGGSPEVLATNGPLATDTGDFRGLHYALLYSPDRGTPEGKRFAEAFRARTGRVPDHWGALGYDSGIMVGMAVQQVGPNRSAIREWFGTIGRSRPAYAGATGSIAFDDARDPIKKQVLVGSVTR